MSNTSAIQQATSNTYACVYNTFNFDGAGCSV